MLDLFAAALPGLEELAAGELRALGLADVEAVAGGATFRGTRDDVMRANLHLRTASRVLVRLGTLHAAAFSELERRAERLPWESFVPAGAPVAFRVSSKRSRLYHTDGVAERLAGAAARRLGGAIARAPGAGEDDDDVPALVVATGDRNHWTISVDSSGALLHRRGWRLATAKAPLRETLAAAMVLASGWDAASPLLDPFCGSGTIAIEAALLARRIAPGRGRRFAFERWPGHDAAAWGELLDGARRAELAEAPPLQGSDRDAGAIEAARANAERAGVADSVDFSRRAFSAIEPPPGPGAVVSNLPRGGRVARGADLRDLLDGLAATLARRCPGWRAALLVGDVRQQSRLRLDDERAIPIPQGGQPVRLVTGRIPAAEA